MPEQAAIYKGMYDEQAAMTPERLDYLRDRIKQQSYSDPAGFGGVIDKISSTPDERISQGDWLDFNPVAKSLLNETLEVLGIAPSKRLVDRVSSLQSPLLRPDTAFGWGNEVAGALADTAQTALSAYPMAAAAPGIVGGYMKAGRSLGESGMVEAWHGSPYKFDKMLTEKIGTGEGAQVFGHGLYFTDKKEIAKHYSDMTNNTAGMGAAWRNLKDKFPKVADAFYSDISQEAHGFPSDATLGVELGNYFKSGGNFRKYISDDTAKLLDEAVNQGYSLPASGSTYRAQLFPGKEPSEYTFLDWYEKPKTDIIGKIKTQAEKEGIYPELENMGGLERNAEHSTQAVYKTLSLALDGDKEASAFLKRAGIDGIRYPADSLGGGGAANIYPENFKMTKFYELLRTKVDINEAADMAKRASMGDDDALKFVSNKIGKKNFDEIQKGLPQNYVVFDDKDISLVSRESGGKIENIER